MKSDVAFEYLAPALSIYPLNRYRTVLYVWTSKYVTAQPGNVARAPPPKPVTILAATGKLIPGASTSLAHNLL